MSLNFHINLFAIHSQQKDKRISYSIRLIVGALLLVELMYYIFSITTIFQYGTELNASVLVNIGRKYEDNKLYVESWIMQITFLIVMAAQIPFIFFSAKESLLIMVDEVLRRSISHALSKKMIQNLEGNLRKSHRISQRLSLINRMSREGRGDLPEDQDQQDLFFAGQFDFQKLNEAEINDVVELNLMNVKHQSFAFTHAKMLKYSEAIKPELVKTFAATLPKDLGSVPAQKLQTLAYKTMDRRISIGATLLMYVIELYCAIAVTNLGDVYGFVGTFSATSLCYFIPSLFFYRAYKLHATEHFKNEHRGLYIASACNFIFGSVLTCFFLYSNILSLQKG